MSAPDAMITPENVDLSNCDREQVQYAGAIQPHGAMLTVSEPDLRVLQASLNCEEMLGIPLSQLLDSPLPAVLDETIVHTLRERLNRHKLEGAPTHLLRASLRGRDFDVFAHRYDGVLLLEFETRGSLEPASALELYSELRATIAHLQATAKLQDFFDLAAAKIREFTGFDRVMIYKFMEDGSGWVRSESMVQGEGLTQYLGLHYPASDIPQPARRLFSLSWLRHQPDIGYTPVPIQPATNPVTGGPLDMSYALLRSVSVMYTGYLKNMGTQSSMVMTLLKEGKLWGLIACHHHRAPKHVPYEVRSACEFLTHMVSLLMSAKEDAENSEYQAKLKSTGVMLVENLARKNDFGDAMLRGIPTLLDFVRAPGAALVVNRKVELLGAAPTEEQILSLTDWLSGSGAEDIFATDALSSRLPEAESYRNVASGVLALRFAKVKNDYILWFRPEQIQTVSWAGDPHKPVDISDDGQRLMPRTSFAIWKETVRGKSEPWQEVELQAVSELRSAILELVLRRAEELGRLYESLERSHAELDSFAYVASHDLKEPLRGIHNYAEMLREDYAAVLGDEGRGRLDTLSRLARRMDDLLGSLLEYSRVGRAEFADAEVDTNQVVAEALETLRPRIAAQNTEIRIPARLPRVRGDSIRLGELFVNLIGNAVKYNDKPEKWVEIGAESCDSGGRYTFYVRDNGIGILPEHWEPIFQIFRRLHARDEFGGGTGVGLTIAKKLVERHGGKLWVDSTVGVGTTFRFTLERAGAV